MKESDIRPAELFEKYLRLSAEDATNCFSNITRQEVPCPACGSQERNNEFAKHGFGYATCTECGTLYQTPRPLIEAFERFYNDSISSKYWAEKFFPAIAEARREKIFRPRIDRLISLCREKKLQPNVIMDVGAGYGIFLEEWKKQFPDARTIAIEPSKHLAEICRSKGIEVFQNIAENVEGFDGTADLVICFEVLEHVYAPLDFIKTLSRFVKKGGYLMVSTLGVDGFDIQILWEKSNSVSPPHHINFLSVEGFKTLFARAGLSDIEVLTPGVLDVDIVRNAYQKDPSCLDNKRFVKQIINDAALAEKFQDFLATNGMSSHTWVLSRK